MMVQEEPLILVELIIGDDLFDLHDVWMSALHQNSDFPQRCDGEAVFVCFQLLDPLERDDIAGLLVHGPMHASKGSFSEALEARKFKHVSARSKESVDGWRLLCLIERSMILPFPLHRA